jgi:alpha-L-fucosidase
VGIRWNSFFGVHDFQVNGEGPFRDNRQAYYRAMCEGMVRELCTRYGELFEIWFDGGASHPDKGAPDVLPIVKKYQPNCLFYHNEQLAEARWGGSESGTVPYPCWATFPNFYSHGSDSPREHLRLLRTGDPNGAYWMPAMSDAPLRGYHGRHEWFWEPGDEAHIYPLENLVEMYYGSVGRNSTLILGLTPDPNGLMPAPDGARLREFGNEIRRRFDKPIAAMSGTGDTLVLDLSQPTRVNHAILMEDIREGERVRAYMLEGLANGNWTKLAEGTCIGHKRIERFDDTTVTKVRLRATQAMTTPVIRSLSVFHVE